MARHAVACDNAQAMKACLEDYRWLISADAAPWLARCQASPFADGGSSPPAAPGADGRAHASGAGAVRTAAPRRGEIRRRPTGCSSRGRAWNRPPTSGSRSSRRSDSPTGQAVADLCCGIGGDLFGLALRGPVTGVDLDPIHTLLAEANGRASDLPACRLETADASVWPVESICGLAHRSRSASARPSHRASWCSRNRHSTRSGVCSQPARTPP